MDLPRRSLHHPDLLPTAAAGAVSGAVAAGAMGLVFVTASRFGVMGEPPPERIARIVAARGPLDRAQAEALDAPLGTVLHLAFGAMLGAVFALVAPSVERRVRATVDAPEPALTTAGAVAFAALVNSSATRDESRRFRSSHPPIATGQVVSRPSPSRMSCSRPRSRWPSIAPASGRATVPDVRVARAGCQS